MSYMDEDTRYKSELSKLKRIYKKIPADQKRVCEKLIGNAAFIAVQLEDLQDTIAREGVVSEYKNGENQYGTKKSPEVEVYNALLKNYTTVVKQLLDLLPDHEADGEDELQKFLRGGHK